MALSFWRNSSPRRKRLVTVGVSFLFLLLITISGILTPMSLFDAQSLSKEIEQTQGDVLTMSLLSGTLFIFRNNFLISLVTFIPFVGPFFGTYVMYNTGLVIAAVSLAAPSQPSPLIMLLVLFIFPFTWMEFIAYSVAISESAWLSWAIIRRRARSELVTALILILVCLVTLLVAALIEMALIRSLI